MQIVGIDVYQVDLPYAGDCYRLSGGRTYTQFDATIVRVRTDTGLEGWGESTPFGSTYIAAHARGVRAGMELLAPAVLGLDPRCLETLNAVMDDTLMGHLDAKTAIDVACWDIFGKASGMPVCDLLGGRVAGRVPVISSIGSDSPDGMRENVAKHRKLGFMGHSIKVGATTEEGGPMLDAERIKACLSDKRPAEWFLVDANGGLSVEHALRMLQLLPSGLDFVLEAPCSTLAETVALRQSSQIPILLDELVQEDSDLIEAVKLNACNGVGLKVSKQGGLTRMRRQRTIAVAAGLVMSVQDTTGSDIAFAAVIHAAQATPKRLLRCALDTRSMVTLKTAEIDAQIIDGGVEAPCVPGLGVTPDRAALGSAVARYE